MNARIWMWLAFVMAYLLILGAIILICFAAWTAWAGEPPVIVPTPVPAPASVGSEVAGYAQGAGALGGGAGLFWMVKMVAGFFADIREHFKAEERGLKKQNETLAEIVSLLKKHDHRIEVEEAAEDLFRKTPVHGISIGAPR